MTDVLDRLAADPRGAQILAWVGRWWWAVLLVVLVLALIPRRSS